MLLELSTAKFGLLSRGQTDSTKVIHYVSIIRILKGRSTGAL